MKPVVVSKKYYRWVGLFVLLLCGGVAVLQEWSGGILLGLFMAVFFAVLGSQKEVFTETGIESWFLWWHDTVGWDNVVQAGIMKVVDRTDSGPNLLLTFSGGTPKTSRMGFMDWKRKNDTKCLNVPVNEELRQMVLHCYGPLDFDLTE